jgi:hypothetical protein
MKPRATIWVLSLIFAAGNFAARAQVQGQGQGPQSQDPSAPNPSASSTAQGADSGKRPSGAARGVSGPNDRLPDDPSQATPDTNTLAGAQLFGVGSLEHPHNIFDPSLSASELGVTLPNSAGKLALASETLVGGCLNFNRLWSKYHFTTIYTGGEIFTRGQNIVNNQDSQFHDLTVMQAIDWARWHILLRDDFVTSPGAAFTGTGMGGPGLIAQLSSTIESTLNSIGQGFVPSETIQNGNAMRYRNASLAQVEYFFNRRSSFTVAGSYGFLQFPGAGFINSRMVNAQAGYDYSFNPNNSVGILASYTKINYPGFPNSTTSYLGALAYGWKMTGRLAFQVAGGPEQIRSTSSAGGFQVWYASFNSALTYERRRNGYSLAFMRGLSSGSGVFAGAESNIITLAAHRQFTRNWLGSINGGYAINNSLAPVGTPTVRFDNWFAGASIGRGIGRHVEVNFNYAIQRQNSPAACPVISCGVVGLQQTFGVTANLHLRPTG